MRWTVIEETCNYREGPFATTRQSFTRWCGTRPQTIHGSCPDTSFAFLALGASFVEIGEGGRLEELATAFNGLDIPVIAAGICTAALDGCSMDFAECDCPLVDGPAAGCAPFAVALPAGCTLWVATFGFATMGTAVG